MKDILLCFYDLHDVNLWEKMLTNIFVEFHHFTEAATGSVLQKKVLLKILECSQENACARVCVTVTGLEPTTT